MRLGALSGYPQLLFKMIGRYSSLICTILLGVLALSSLARAVDEIKIGILIKHRGLEEPLNKTLERLNADTSVLTNIRLVALVELIETDNSYQASAAGKLLG